MNSNNRCRNTIPNQHQIQPPNDIFLYYLDIGMNLKLCQFNIEGISRSKSEYLARFTRDEDVIDVIAIQETHKTFNVDLYQRGEMIGAIHSSKHGIKISLLDCQITYQDHMSHVHVLTVELARTGQVLY
jgi:hypothetical protein